MLLLGYARSAFRGFKTHLRTVVGLKADEVQLFLKQYNSNFVIYEVFPGVYPMKVFSEAVYTMHDHKGTLCIEYGDISRKQNLF